MREEQLWRGALSVGLVRMPVRLEHAQLDAEAADTPGWPNADAASEGTLHILDFVRLDEVEPIYVAGSHYLVPDGYDRRAYETFARALDNRRRAGLGRVATPWGDRAVLVRSLGDALAVTTLRPSRHVLAPWDIDALAPAGGTAAEDVRLAETLVDALASDFTPSPRRDLGADVVPAEEPHDAAALGRALRATLAALGRNDAQA